MVNTSDLELKNRSYPSLLKTPQWAPLPSGQNAMSSRDPIIADSDPLSDTKAISNSHLFPELQLCKSHGLLDTSLKVSPISLYLLCPQLPLASLPNLLLLGPHFKGSHPTHPSGLSLCASSSRNPSLTLRKPWASS